MRQLNTTELLQRLSKKKGILRSLTSTGERRGMVWIDRKVIGIGPC